MLTNVSLPMVVLGIYTLKTVVLREICGGKQDAGRLEMRKTSISTIYATSNSLSWIFHT
jgi:hypothetical protein